MNQNNLEFQPLSVSRENRNEKYGHKSLTVWFTGLSGSGKSTLTNMVSSKLFENNIITYNLDGDNTRLGINKDLGFSLSDRSENLRRVAEVSKLFVDGGIVVLTSFISPMEKDRFSAKEIIGLNDFVEVFVDCPLEICESRDVKGLYQKARNGVIKDFTGIDSPFEEPSNPDITVNTFKNTAKECSEKIFSYIINRIK